MFRLARKFRHTVKRLYAFSWTGSSCVGFDAGLVRADGSTRPGYRTFKAKCQALISDLEKLRPAISRPVKLSTSDFEKSGLVRYQP